MFVCSCPTGESKFHQQPRFKGEEIDAAYDGRKVTLQERRGKEGRAYGHTYNLPQSTPGHKLFTFFSHAQYTRSYPRTPQNHIQLKQ